MFPFNGPAGPHLEVMALVTEDSGVSQAGSYGKKTVPKDREVAGAEASDATSPAAAMTPDRACNHVMLLDFLEFAGGQTFMVVGQKSLHLRHQHVKTDDVGDGHGEDHGIGEVDDRA